MKIRCIDIQNKEYGDGKHLTLLKEYEVIKEDKNTYLIKNDINDDFWYRKSLFEIVKENNELNIIEASNMPYDTEFKVKIDHYYKYDDARRIRDNTKLIAVNTQSGIKFKEYKGIEKASKTLINAKFVPIQKTVSTVEAFKALEEGKIIESLCTHEKYIKDYGQLSIIVDGFENEECENISSAEILDDWIIIDAKEYINTKKYN